MSCDNRDDNEIATAAAATSGLQLQPPKTDVQFSDLPWNLNLPDEHRFVQLTTTKEWTVDHHAAIPKSLYDYGKDTLPFRPATTSLNYGTTIWEGLKCYRTADDKAVVFRADRNWERMRYGAMQMCLPAPSQAMFMRAVQVAIQQNAALIPPVGGGMKLYVRPLLYGSGQQLGLHPSPEFSFLVYVSPTGNYFKNATAGLNLHLETRRSRAARGGTGNVKCAGNYAVALKPLMDAKPLGFADNLFIDLETLHAPGATIDNAVLQEMSAANVFLVLPSGEICTPSLERGTILPGVTRASIIDLINLYKSDLLEAVKISTGNLELTLDDVKAVERDVTVRDLSQAVEAFGTGTAAEIVPIARVATAEYDTAVSEPFEIKFPHGATLPGGPVTSKLLLLLRQAMTGQLAEVAHWLRDPFAPEAEFCA